MEDPVILFLSGLSSGLGITLDQLQLLLGVIGVILLGTAHFRASNGGGILSVFGWPMIGMFFYLDIPHYIDIADPVLIVMSAAGLPITFLLAIWEFKMHKRNIEDEAIIWTRGLVALGAGPYLIIANIPYLNVAAVWVTAVSANLFLGFSGIEGYELGSVLVDTGVRDVDWSEWNGNRWILTEQLGEAGFYIPLIKQVDGTTEVGFVMACSAMQSMAVFIGALWAIRTAPWKRRVRAAIITIPTIFVLNTFRNAGIVWLHASYPQWQLLGVTMFDFAHSYAAKAGSLGAMFLMALVIFDLLPQMHTHIMRLLSPLSLFKSDS
tara:strand:- start:102 stop:1067 length:966 start_codon:yes stop_codon:yes gene_type:complete